MQVAANKNGIRLTLTTEEAVALEVILGSLASNVAPVLSMTNWYDEIADVLENSEQVENIGDEIQKHGGVKIIPYSDYIG